MSTEWNNYKQSLTEEYGKLTNLIWISKKRQKYVLDFAYTRTLFINKNKYKYADIISSRIEDAPQQNNDKQPYILLIGVRNNTDAMLSLTIWSKHIANRINNLLQEIIQSNKKLQ